MKYIEDPGHAWLELPAQEVLDSDADISAYSYFDKKTGLAYLEEDCDAAKFLVAVDKLKDENGGYIKYPSEYQENTFVRDLPRWPWVKQK